MATQRVRPHQTKTLVDEHQRLENLVENLRQIFFAEHTAPPTIVVGLLHRHRLGRRDDLRTAA